jgi:hypothetical protein
VSHIGGVLNLQARARRNALQATRVLRVRRDEQVEADRAVRVAAAIPPDAPADTSEGRSSRSSRR